MSSLFGQIEEARTVAEVVAIVRDHLATWTPQEISRLPPACRPGRIRDEMDIANLHSLLVDAYRTTRASGDALTALQLLTSFLVRSSVRVAELGGETRASAPTTTDTKRSARSGG